MRLSPKDPELPFYLVNFGIHHLFEERYEEACVWAEKALHENPHFPSGYRLLTTANGLLGNQVEAHQAYEKIWQLVPGMTVKSCKETLPFAFAADVERYAQGLRLAGVPEE